MAPKHGLTCRQFEGKPFCEAIRTWYEKEGLTIYDIAERLGCNATTVLYHLRKLGVQMRVGGVPKGYKWHNPERGAKISGAMKGRILTGDWKRKISEARKEGGYSRERNPRWRGGVKRRADGYVALYRPDHPRANTQGYVMEHILVMEKKLGRPLQAKETVHHINSIRNDNHPENLHLYATPNEHAAHHMRERHRKRRETKRSIG